MNFLLRFQTKPGLFIKRTQIYLHQVGSLKCASNLGRDLLWISARTQILRWGRGILGNFMRRFGRTSAICKTNKPVRFSHFCLVAFSPLSFFKRKSDSENNVLSPEILSNIPKEVFKKDIFKNKSASNVLKRLFTKIWDCFRISLRFLYIVCLFSPFLWTYPLTYLSSSVNTLWLHAMLWALESAGPTFIKLGQWIATRRDIFSADLCELFSKLHDSTHIHSWYITKKKLRKAFGKRWRLLFEKFEEVPIGSGCVGQVHRAYMCSDMIPDESIVQEVLSLDESGEPEIDFAEGLEVVGLHRVDEYVHRKEETEMEKEKEERRKVKMSPPLTSQSGTTDADSPATGGQQLQAKQADYPNEEIEIVKRLDSSEPIPMGEVTLIPVAVKVLHPGIYRHVQRDLTILRFFARLLETLFPKTKWLSAREAVEEFADLLTRQIDLRYEADCLEKFGENFENNPNIRFPKPIRPYCKRDVLVETLEEGEPIKHFLREEREEEFADHTLLVTRNSLKQILASYGINALLQMVFVHNFVHGDLHPGNILVQNADSYTPQDESKLIAVDVCDTVILQTKPVECPLRLVLLDVGISNSLQPQDLNNLRAVITAVVLGEDEKVAELMLKHARYQDCPNAEGFKSDMASVVKKFRTSSLTLGKVQVGELLSQVFSTCCHHRVKMESNFASILLAIFVLEGIGRSLDPGLDILDEAKLILFSKP